MAIEGLGKCPLCWKQIHEATPVNNVTLGNPPRAWVCHQECKTKLLAEKGEPTYQYTPGGYQETTQHLVDGLVPPDQIPIIPPPEPPIQTQEQTPSVAPDPQESETIDDSTPPSADTEPSSMTSESANLPSTPPLPPQTETSTPALITSPEPLPPASAASTEPSPPVSPPKKSPVKKAPAKKAVK